MPDRVRYRTQPGKAGDVVTEHHDLAVAVRELDAVTAHQGRDIYATAEVLNALQAVADRLAWQFDRSEFGRAVDTADVRAVLAAHGASQATMGWAARIAAAVCKAPPEPQRRTGGAPWTRHDVLHLAADTIGDPDAVTDEYIRGVGALAAAVTGANDPVAVRDLVCALARARSGGA